jgi:hypothetical protein
MSNAHANTDDRRERTMETDGAGATHERPRRGEVGRQTYERVQQLIGEGHKATESFALVANETGRSAATVATAYYRVARSMPGGGGVRQRPRRGRPRGSTTARGGQRARTTQGLVRELTEAADRLARHAEQLERDLASARADAQRFAEIQRLIGRR